MQFLVEFKWSPGYNPRQACCKVRTTFNSNQGRVPFNKNSGLKFRKCHVPNGTVHSACTHPTQASARLVIVLVSRIQKSGSGDNNFVKWKGSFYPACQRRIMSGFRIRKLPTKRSSLSHAKKNLWYPGWGHFGPTDQNDQMYVPTEVSGILG